MVDINSEDKYTIIKWKIYRKSIELVWTIYKIENKTVYYYDSIYWDNIIQDKKKWLFNNINYNKLELSKFN